MKKAIVITSIYLPTDAIRAFAALEDYIVVVVGDQKTNPDWNCDRVSFLSIEKQRTIKQKLSALLPLNHYSRKMIGYLYALQLGCNIIIDADDDIYPKEDWGYPSWEGPFLQIDTNKGFINIYQYFTKQKIWPRGLPLTAIQQDIRLVHPGSTENCKIGVWQGLSDENPDVDAIYRLTNNASCIFDHREPIVLGKNNVCPFNSQNTAFRKELFELLYLPTSVSFRFTDILRSLVAQPIMWLYGYRLGFTHATTVQRRNPHDYLEDFKSELPMYLHVSSVIDLVAASISANDTIGQNLVNAYQALEKQGIVEPGELTVLETWLQEF